MNVPNHEKKAFRELTPEERSAIVEAWLAGNAEYFSMENEWAKKFEDTTIALSTIYRTRPRQLVIPWQHIKPEYKWAAMDMDGDVILYTEKPDKEGSSWGVIAEIINIDTTGIDWQESLTQRPQ